HGPDGADRGPHGPPEAGERPRCDRRPGDRAADRAPDTGRGPRPHSGGPAAARGGRRGPARRGHASVPRRAGGTQQKVWAAREISRDPKVLIAAQPTRGLDVGAIEYLHRRLVEERDEGRAILLVSLELDEILSLSDRILVIYEG